MALEVKGWDLAIVTGSIRMEGTTHQYAPLEFLTVADLAVTNSPIVVAKELKLLYHVGLDRSKDVFYGQHLPETKPVCSELKRKW